MWQRVRIVQIKAISCYFHQGSQNLCIIVVVKNNTLWYERSDNSKRGWMTVSLLKLPHGGNPSQEGLYQVMHLENLSTYECC